MSRVTPDGLAFIRAKQAGQKRPAKKTKLTHGQLVTSASKLLTAFNVVHSITQGMPVPLPDGKGYRRARAIPGWPDITAIYPGSGKLWGIEVKITPDKPSKAQIKCLADIEAANGITTLVVDSCDGLYAVLNLMRIMNRKNNP